MTFDPGIYGLDDMDPDHLDVLELVSECFKVQYPGQCGKCPVITDGSVQLVDSFVDIENVLFDSGAMQASYISKRWVDENRDQIGKRLRPCRGRVRMADNQTVVDVHERFRTMVSFTMSTGQVVCGL